MPQYGSGRVVRFFCASAVAWGFAFSDGFAQPCDPVRIEFNGSFESPQIAANSTEQTTPTGWTWTNTLPFRGFIFNGNLGPPWPAPPVGSQFLDIGNTTNYGIEQAFTVPEPRFVTFSWRVAQGAVSGSAGYDMTVINMATGLPALTVVDAFVTPTWNFASTSNRLEGGNYKIRFTPRGVSSIGPDTLIDDVGIELRLTPSIGGLINTYSFGCNGRSTTFAVDNLAGLSPLVLTWSYTPNGGSPQTVVEGFNPGLGTVVGAGTPSITISNVAVQSNTEVTCTLSNACGSSSGSFQLFGCIADFNCSGGVSVQDIFDFLAEWFAASPAANVNGVGGVTVQDVFDFLTAWFSGC